MAISIIVPVYNEKDVLSQRHFFFKNLSQHAELIFVDGGSTDNTIQLANIFAKVKNSQKGRARQMNCGAQQAKHDILLFLHADNSIPLETVSLIEDKIKNNGFIGGCFSQKLDKKGLIFRILESHGNIRARISKVFYGDQGIFVRKDVFLKLNGFPEVPIMEDVIFTKKLRECGKTIVLPNRIIASARRWKKNGLTKTIIIHNLITILFWLKVPLHKISKLYEDVR